MVQKAINNESTLIKGGSGTSVHSSENCFHCSLPTINPIYETSDLNKDRPFCCNGCKTVFHIIKEGDLEKYYQLKRDAEIVDPSPVVSSKENYRHFDEENFKKEYVTRDPRDGSLEIKLYLEGVHCIACLWLIENTPQILDSIISAQLDFDNSLAIFKLKKDSSLSELGVTLNKLGYIPHSIKNDDELRAFKIKEERDYLIKMGIAMACMGNILLFSISIYAGLEGTLKKQFEWLSFVIALPVLLYSALPFYKSALTSLRQKRFNIDLPISIALIAGGFGGLYTLISNTGEIFFDSLTSLVFLLLLSRYALLKIKQKGVSSSSLEYFSSFGTVTTINADDQDETILAKYLVPGKRIRLSPGDMIPADGKVIEGKGYINTSLLTGESNPIKTKVGSQVFSGTQVISGNYIVSADLVGEETRLGKILKEVHQKKGRLSPIANLSEKISRYFVGIVLIVSAAILFYFYSIGNISEGSMRALTLLIITCPCALALATPLALTSAIQRLSAKGIIVKSEDTLEKLAKSQEIFLDKTGTLTKGLFQVTEWSSNEENLYYDIIWSLEYKAQHPIAQALRNYIEAQNEIKEVSIENWKEVPGEGVYGEISGDVYKIKKFSSADALSTTIALYKNENPVVKIQLRDNLRPDSIHSINRIKQLGLKPSLVSGDSKSNVLDVARLLEINEVNTYFRVTPKDKMELVKKSPLAIMVGDGANDAMALKDAEIGIAVKGSIDISLQAADIYLSKLGVSPLADLIEISRDALKVIKRNMVFSLFYNLIGATLAIKGIINPLWAAVLMPISSLTVLLSTYMWKKEVK